MIEVKHLTKRYGNRLAVDDISFTIEEGKIYGFLGPNGAGKSTTMNILTGCLAATGGEVKINGFDIFEEPQEAKKHIGYLPELPPVYLDRTVREYLGFVAEAKKVPAKEIKSEVDRVVAATRIEEHQNRLIRNLSKGYRQRVGIAEAIIGNPKIIILDEPTVGLDPQQIIEVRELIASLREGHAVILSSHILSEIQAVCDMILIISRGKMLAFDTAENLEKTFGSRVTINIRLACDEKKAKEILLPAFADGSAAVEYTENGAFTDVTVTENTDNDTARCEKIYNAVKNSDVVMLQLATDRASLEDIFIELTEEAERARDIERKEALQE